MNKKKVVVAGVALGLTLLTATASFANSSQTTQPVIADNGVKVEQKGHVQKVLEIQDLQKELPFQIVLPDNLPDGVVLRSALLSKPPVENEKLIQAILNFSNEDGSIAFVVYEQLGTFDLKKDSKSKIKDKKINLKEATYATGDRLTGLSWSKGNVNFFAWTNSDSSIANEVTFVGIADSF